MKYAIVLLDGAADVALDELDGKTPLQTAEIPNIDWISSHGKIGTVRNIPDHLPCGSDVAILSVLGYDPRHCYTGRAPLEAAAKDLQVDDDTWIFRCNLVTIVDGVMADYAAGHITNKEAHALIHELNKSLGCDEVQFHPGLSYRHLMTYKGEVNVKTTPPHDILSRKADGYLPTGRGAGRLRELIQRSGEILDEHAINAVRRDLGENPATSIWLWGQGKTPDLTPFADRFGLRAAAITGVDLVRGLAKLIGWDCIEVDGATGYLDTNYAGKGAAAVAAIDEYDLVMAHIEAPDEAGHSANAKGKVAAIEQIDKHIVGPILRRLRAEMDGQWRILALPDHPTPCTVRTHTPDPVPFALAGEGVKMVVGTSFDEDSAAQADLHIPRGCELMEYFLTVR